jgi:hypothetical protein
VHVEPTIAANPKHLGGGEVVQLWSTVAPCSGWILWVFRRSRAHGAKAEPAAPGKTNMTAATGSKPRGVVRLQGAIM